jgi:hypothetical protein
MVEMKLQSMTNVAIALALGMEEKSVSRIVTSPMFQGEMARRRRDLEVRVSETITENQRRMREKTSEAGYRGAEVLLDLMENSEAEGLRLKAAEIGLRQAFEMEGSGKDHGPAQMPTTVNYNLLLEGLRESKAPSGPDLSDDIIDVEPAQLPAPEKLNA